MVIDSHRPIKEVNETEFKELLRGKRVIVGYHAMDHLSDAQRKIFKEEELKDMLRKEAPRKIYLQANGRFSPYYRRSEGYRRLIISIGKEEVTIVTFTDPDVLPQIRLKKNDG